MKCPSLSLGNVRNLGGGFIGWCLSIFSLFFKRSGDTDDLRGFSCKRIGLSAAASWSWGLSIGFGMLLLPVRGIVPACAWMIGNVLAIPLFGLIYTYFPLVREWPKYRVMVALFFFVEIFVIIINLQGIFMGLGGEVMGFKTYVFHLFLFGYEIPHRLLVIAIGLVVIWYIRKGGLKWSVFTDLSQYAVQLIFVMFLATYGYMLAQALMSADKISYVVGLSNWNGPEWVYSWLYNHNANTGLQWIAPGGADWIKFGFFGIIVGAIGTGHHWQRFSVIKVENVVKSSLWGGALFGIYMLFVFISGLFFQENIILGRCFLIAMLALGTSSIDSGVAGFEYILEKCNIKAYWASIISVILLFIWPFLIDLGMGGQWTLMAKIRLGVIIFMVIATLYKKIKQA